MAVGGVDPNAARGAHYMSLMLLLGGLYISTSAGLIAFNKYLMHKDRFPYAVCLVLIHAGFCSVSTFILYLIKPSLFPSLSDPVLVADGGRRVPVDKDLILKNALPIGVFFSGQLVLSNTAYLHSSVAFLQMMKEANLILIYLMSLAVALEYFQCRHIGILCVILLGTTLTIHGEMNFSWTGFMIQGSSQIFECTKIVLQALLLTSAGKKLDALTYVMLVMPMCFLVLSALLVWMVYVQPIEHLAAPHSWSEVMRWSPLLGVNACVALALNIIIALFVKHSSAVAFILAGIVKDAAIVFAGTMFFDEIVSQIQFVGFIVQLAGIMVWSLMKSFPEPFEAGVFAGLAAVLFGWGEPPKSKKEKDASYGTLKSADSKA
jgi:hypothetical protein